MLWVFFVLLFSSCFVASSSSSSLSSFDLYATNFDPSSNQTFVWKLHLGNDVVDVEEVASWTRKQIGVCTGDGLNPLSSKTSIFTTSSTRSKQFLLSYNASSGNHDQQEIPDVYLSLLGLSEDEKTLYTLLQTPQNDFSSIYTGTVTGYTENPVVCL